MAQVALSEQMGAMSIIDSLRHRQMQVQEHLNLPERRREVADRIRSFYEAQGMQVSEDVIKQGVAQFFANRLVLESQVMPTWQQRIARLHITRKRWLGKAMTTLWVTIGVIGLANIAINVSERMHIESVQKMVSTASLERDELLTKLQSQIEAAQKILAQQAAMSNPLESATRMASAVVASSGLEKDKIPEAINEVADSLNADDLKLRAEKAAVSRGTSKVVLQKNREKLLMAAELMGLHQQHLDLVRGQDFAGLGKAFPKLVVLAGDARKALDEADAEGVGAAKVAMSALSNGVLAAKQSTQLSLQIESSIKALESMKMNSVDAQIVNAMALQARQDMESLDTSRIKSALSRLTATLEFAKTPLQLNVVDRSGVKSGVERNYKASGGKSWYAIVEAVDAKGNVIGVPVKSVETSEQRTANVFGIRISREEYEKLKKDKLDDGHVDNRLMGKKPASALSFDFGGRTSERPDMILAW